MGAHFLLLPAPTGGASSARLVIACALTDHEHRALGMGHAGAADRSHDLREEAAAAAPADHQELGVPALLDEDLGRGAELHGPGQALRNGAAEGAVQGLVDEAFGRLFKLGGGGRAFLGQMGGQEEIRGAKAGDDLQRRVEALAMRPASRSAVVEKSEPSTPTTIR